MSDGVNEDGVKIRNFGGRRRLAFLPTATHV